MEALKPLIREKLRSSPAVAQVLEGRPDLQDDPVKLLQVLEEHGFVDDLYTCLEDSLTARVAPSSAPAALVPVHGAATTAANAAASAVSARGVASQPLPDGLPTPTWQLCLKLQVGRAFLDYLEERDREGRDLQWHLSFGSQRFIAHPVPAAVDPRFDATFMLALPTSASRAGLLQHDASVHLVLLCRQAPTCKDDVWDATTGSMIVASHHLEWRRCLCAAGPLQLTLELQGIGRRHQLPVGALHAELELLPVGSVADALPEAVVGAQLQAEEQRRRDVLRRVFEDFDRWWSQYHELYRTRHMRLFAQTESCHFLPLASFVAPLPVGRALDSPDHAWRWVTVIATEPTPLAEAAEPRWRTLQAVWARGRATVEEKVLLLCSLLLGFRLDAWCCLGTDAAGQPHAWVVVRDGGDGSTPEEVTCWDVRSVRRINTSDASYLSSYSSIDTLFNDRRMLVCHAGIAARASFDLSDFQSWLSVPFDDEAASTLSLYPALRRPPFADLRPKVWPLPTQTDTIEQVIEERLTRHVQTHRESVGLPSHFDEHLGQLLHFALYNCESERLGIESQAGVFARIVRRLCLAEEEFRAVPMQFNHLRLSHFWPRLSDRMEVRDLLAAPASATFAVRARVASYPEGAVVTWVALALLSRS